MIKITCISFEEYRLDDLKLMYVLNLLSSATKEEENIFLLPREVDFYLTNSLCLVYAFSNNDFVGAACVIRCLDNRTIEEMFVEESRLVVELGSNYVLPRYRGKHIGKKFIIERLKYCESKNYFPVSVTSNSTIKKIFEKVGGVLMNKYPKYLDLCSRIRTCYCPKDQKIHNSDCKMLNKEVWMFNNSNFKE